MAFSDMEVRPDFFFFNSLQLYRGQLHKRCYQHVATKERANANEQNWSDLGQAATGARCTPRAYPLASLQGLLGMRLKCGVHFSQSV